MVTLKQLRPEAKEFLPADTKKTEYHPTPFFPIHQKQPQPLPLPLPVPIQIYQKSPLPLCLPAPPSLYFDKFGVAYFPCFLPTFSGPTCRFDACRQPTSTDPLLRLPSADEAFYPPRAPLLRSPDGGGADKTISSAVLKKLSPRRRNEIPAGKTLRRILGGPPAVWVPKKRNSGVEVVVGDCIRSPPSQALDDGGSISGRTSVMIRNIPNQFRRHMLMEFLDDLCLEQNQKSDFESNPTRFEYDFLYLPMDFRQNNNVGYAFVNFTCAVAATMVGDLLRDFKWGAFKDITGRIRSSRKVCEITWANSQGRAELEGRFRNSQFRCRNMEYLPVVFSPPRDGVNPTAALPTIVGTCLPPL